MILNRIDIQDYVNSILGTKDIIIEDNVLMSGMEDIVNRIGIVNPKALKVLETPVILTRSSSSATGVSSFSTMLQYVPADNEEIKVYYVRSEIPKLAIRVDNPEQIMNPYSLLNDGSYGKRYYWLEGKNLFAYPPIPAGAEDKERYCAEIVKYGIEGGGKLIWHDRYIYPLALYCSIFELNKVFNAYVSLLVNKMITDKIPYDYSNVEKRLNKDDVELASAELQKIQTIISEQATASDKLRVTMENVVNILQRIRNLRQEYYDWFGVLSQAPGGVQ